MKGRSGDFQAHGSSAQRTLSRILLRVPDLRTLFILPPRAHFSSRIFDVISMPYDPRRESYVLIDYLRNPVIHHPVHHHSFRSSFFQAFRSCALCHAYVWMNPLSPGVECLDCGLVLHRACLENDHKNDKSASLLPVCPRSLETWRKPQKPPSSSIKDATTSGTFVHHYVVQYAPYVAGSVMAASVVGGPMALVAAAAGFGLTHRRGKEEDDMQWAREICQAHPPPDGPASGTVVPDFGDPQNPDHQVIFSFLFQALTRESSSLCRLNRQLYTAFGQRHPKRRALDKTKTTNEKKKNDEQMIRDTKIYIGHVLAVTLAFYPELGLTESTILSCTSVIEELIYADVYTTVFRVFQEKTQAVDHALSLISHSKTLVYHPTRSLIHTTLAFAQALTHVRTCARLQSPIQKLNALNQAFIAACDAIERGTGKMPNADRVLPTIQEVILHSLKDVEVFAAQLAFITVLTGGGGRGMEGYTLTTFQAALEVIQHRQEERKRGVYEHDDNSSASESESEEEEFFDAQEENEMHVIDSS